MAELSRDELHRLARLGAQRRLEEIRQEEASIRAAFPDLFGGVGGRRGGRRGRPPKFAGGNAGTPVAGKRPARYRMTAAQRRAVSERMKKYWAGRRKAKG